MKKLVLLFPLALLAACGDSSDKNTADSTSTKDSVTVTDSAPPRSTVLDTVPQQSSKALTRISGDQLAEAIAKNTPDGWAVLDTMTGDLNRDAYQDLLIVLRWDEKFISEDEARPLLVLIGDAEGQLHLAARNDSVVLCEGCGGVWGDPYEGLAIKNGYFSVEHYGGSNWRWTRIITFKYSEKEKTWLLHRDAGVSYNTGDPEGTEEETATNQEHYGKMKFVDYNNK